MTYLILGNCMGCLSFERARQSVGGHAPLIDSKRRDSIQPIASVAPCPKNSTIGLQPALAMHYFRRLLTTLGVLTSHPAAFVIVFLYVGAWVTLSPSSFDWHAVATIATWFMTLLIQRAEYRDTQGIHAKLDELLRAEGRARSEISQIDNEEPEVIEEHRLHERRP